MRLTHAVRLYIVRREAYTWPSTSADSHACSRRTCTCTRCMLLFWICTYTRRACQIFVPCAFVYTHR